MGYGPNPEPAALKKLKGNPSKEAKAKLDAEPQPTVGEPPCPPHIEAVPLKKATWDYVCSELSAMRTLGTSDQATIAHYCDVWYEYVNYDHDRKLFRDALEKSTEGSAIPLHSGFVLVSDKKTAYGTAWGHTFSMLSKLLIAASRELGLSASSRTGIHATPTSKAAEKKLEKFGIRKAGKHPPVDATVLRFKTGAESAN